MFLFVVVDRLHHVDRLGAGQTHLGHVHHWSEVRGESVGKGCIELWVGDILGKGFLQQQANVTTVDDCPFFCCFFFLYTFRTIIFRRVLNYSILSLILASVWQLQPFPRVCPLLSR